MVTEQYSAEWVEHELAGRGWMPLRRCSICRSIIGYRYSGEHLFFVASCSCTITGDVMEAKWQDIADALSLQKNDEVRDRIMATLKGEREPE